MKREHNTITSIYIQPKFWRSTIKSCRQNTDWLRKGNPCWKLQLWKCGYYSDRFGTVARIVKNVIKMAEKEE